MKIVVTNWSGLTDSHVERLKKHGEVELFEGTDNENYAERLKGTDVAVIDCYVTPVTKELLSNVPDLKYFTINSTGYNNVDVDAVKNTVLTPHIGYDSEESIENMANIITENIEAYITGKPINVITD